MLRIAVLARMLVLVAAGALLAACEPGMQFGELTGETTGSSRVVTVVGAPDTAKAQILSAIGSRGAEEGLSILVDGSASTDYTINGYMSALHNNGGTQFAYVWDVFDAAGERRHRIAGSLTRNARKDDPWAVFDAGAAREIASTVVASMKDWLATVTPPEPAAPDPAADAPNAEAPAAVPEPKPDDAGEPVPVAAAKQATSSALALVEPPTVTAATDAIRSATPDTARFRPIAVRIADIRGTEPDGEAALIHAITKALTPYGVDLTSATVGAKYQLIADVSSTPSQKGSDLLAIIWTVKDGDRTVGTVRQLNKVASATDVRHWAPKASESAANGIATLIQPNPVK